MKKTKTVNASAIDSIERHEGFRSTPYPDPIHGWEKPTFGHGLTYITEEESHNIVKNRVRAIIKELSRKKPIFMEYPELVQDIIIEMAYQMGVEGVLKFKRMFENLDRAKYSAAADEMRDSLWYKQTRNRAEELASRMEKLDGDKR